MPSRRWVVPVAALLLLGVALAVKRSPSPGTGRGPALREGVSWLLRHQSRDGLWHADLRESGCLDPAGCGGPVRFAVDPALTGLAVLAIARAGPAEPARRAAARRAARGLAAIQRDDGGFGPAGTERDRFNCALGVLAILEALPDAPRLRDAAGRGLGLLEGWAGRGEADDCEAGWILEAAAAARVRGLAAGPGPGAALLRRAEALRAQGRSTTAAPEAVRLLLLRAAGRPPGEREGAVREALRGIEGPSDRFLSLFALRALGPEPAAPRAALGRLRARLLASLDRTPGCARGSAAPPDLWWEAGGRIYATAATLLALEEP